MRMTSSTGPAGSVFRGGIAPDRLNTQVGFNPQPAPPPQLRGMGAMGDGMSDTAMMAVGALSTASMAASAYHGYKRHDSVGWALWWGLMGAMFPVITPTIAVAQGFGKRSR